MRSRLTEELKETVQDFNVQDFIGAVMLAVFIVGFYMILVLVGIEA